MNSEEGRRRFDTLVMPHLDAAYNLARWLTHDEHDACDVVQDAFVRALRHIGGFRGDNARGWVLQIVRNTCFTRLRQNRPAMVVGLDEDDALDEMAGPGGLEPEASAMRGANRVQIDRAIAALPMVYREVLVLRELEDLAYSDIARIVDIPIGTVMSRLSRARALMRGALTNDARPPLRVVPKANP